MKDVEERSDILGTISTLVGIAATCLVFYITITGDFTAKHLLSKASSQWDKLHYPCQVKQDQAVAAAFDRGVKAGHRHV